MPLNSPHFALRRAIVFAMVLVLWCAGTLGLLHGTLHWQAALPVASADAASGGDDSAFHADDSDQCRLYDQLSSGTALTGMPALALPLLLPAVSLHFILGEALARWAALYDARGPPAAR